MPPHFNTKREVSAEHVADWPHLQHLTIRRIDQTGKKRAAMSRGPGKVQRAILAKLEADPRGCFWLTEFVGAGYTESHYKSAYRATVKLHEAGLIGVKLFRYGRETVAIHKLDVDPCEITRRAKRNPDELRALLAMAGR